ncbi:aminotransferase class V-fold PLP-dependent enzyme [Sphingobium sp. H39-3-25]|uniref:aminotransferase class V-fold PLP-dependent enzyme n=1 Tax=Sphingobium arseniciresistens TaxID=3030834 RepID=UPI0023BA2B81|nr:aminotransferase class V-fold PLP-dependent enzyme [Sphingobium arseniciresistens]
MVHLSDDAVAISRRGLMKGAAMASLALPVAAAAKADGHGGTLRQQMVLAPDIRYFNAANIGPTFRAVTDAQQRETAAFQGDPSYEYRARYPELADRLRARIGARLNVTAQEIALVRNASEANTVAVRGLAFKPGDQVIVTEHNHQSTLDTWRLRAEREGLELVILPTPVTARTVQEVTDGFAKAIGPRTRAIFLSHMTNVTGLVYPVAQIAALAKARGIWLHVDGAQSFGWMKLDLAGLGCDSFSGSTHKWLLGPLESGILYVKRERQAALHPLMLSHGYWLTDPANLDTAQKYEILGQRDDPKLDAIAQTLDIVDGIGEQVIEARVQALAADMRRALAQTPGVRVVGSSDPALCGPVITVALEGRDVAAVRRHLWQAGKVATAQAKAQGQALVRFSPHIYNSAEEIAAVASLLAKA